MLPHKNVVVGHLSRLFNISQLSEMHFKMVSNEFWKVYSAFLPDMETLYNTFTVPEAHKYEQHKTRSTERLWTCK